MLVENFSPLHSKRGAGLRSLKLVFAFILAAQLTPAAGASESSSAGPAQTVSKEGQAASSPLLHFVAKVYDEKSGKQKLLFTYQHNSVGTANGRTLTNTYLDPENHVVAVETTEVGSPDKAAGGAERVVSYKMSQRQIGAEGQVEIRGSRAYFAYTKDGKTKTDDEKVSDDFVVGPSLVGFLHSKWEKILKGEHIKARFAVLDRRETVGFEYYKEKEADVDGKHVIVVKMKPSSLVISAVVNPLHFYLTPDGSRLVQLDGRTQLKTKDGSNWRDLDAVTVYEY